MSEPAIVTLGLTKDYGSNRGVFDLDLEVARGEILGFIGPNGAGKTTTIRLLMDFTRPTRGTARILGLDSRKDSIAVKRLVGYLPGELPVYPGATAWEIIGLLAAMRGGIDQKYVRALADRFQLDLTRRYRDLSHGNKQKLWLLQAFMHRPQVLILDEPTLGLDPLIQAEFNQLVVECVKAGATVFLSSHVLSEVQTLCDRIALVGSGRLLRIGTLEQLRELRVHRVDATLRKELDVRILGNVPGLSDVSLVDHHLRCTVRGDFEPLLETLVRSGVVELDSEELSLEEVFLAAYGKSAA